MISIRFRPELAYMTVIPALQLTSCLQGSDGICLCTCMTCLWACISAGDRGWASTFICCIGGCKPGWARRLARLILGDITITGGIWLWLTLISASTSLLAAWSWSCVWGWAGLQGGEESFLSSGSSSISGTTCRVPIGADIARLKQQKMTEDKRKQVCGTTDIDSCSKSCHSLSVLFKFFNVLWQKS